MGITKLNGTNDKNPPANVGDARNAGSTPGSGRSPEEGMAAHNSILAWRIPSRDKPEGLQSMSPWGCKESHTHTHLVYLHLEKFLFLFFGKLSRLRVTFRISFDATQTHKVKKHTPSKELNRPGVPPPQQVLSVTWLSSLHKAERLRVTPIGHAAQGPLAGPVLNTQPWWLCASNRAS